MITLYKKETCHYWAKGDPFHHGTPLLVKEKGCRHKVPAGMLVRVISYETNFVKILKKDIRGNFKVKVKKGSLPLDKRT